jgi:2-polyprenyl-3-methyl-5-hydroxy-6-metoxy-1,4-benzoquinol methylase
MHDLNDLATRPALARLVGAILAEWPRHRRYLEINLAERSAEELDVSEQLAGMVLRLSGDSPEAVAALAADYRFISEKIILPEELHFRRTGAYRLSTFEEAIAQVYSRHDFMTRYMNGLLVTDVIWINHCRCMRHYRERFLPGLPAGADLLEIGPGHGLLLALAAQEPRVGTLTAWDVSQASLDASRHSMETLDVGRHVAFQQRDIFQDMSGEASRFDAIVLSEVLEHLERPQEALRVLHGLCRPGGQVWINVPANSPAPDHLYLIRHPDEAVAAIREAGFEIVDTANFAMSGTTLDRAIREKLTISCVVVGRRPL